MCESINPKYNEICKKENNKRFCKFCEGTSGLSREQEEKYLELRLKNKTFSHPEPNIIKKVINLSNAIISHINNGSKICSQDLVEKRINICLSCDKYNPNKDSCSECGCYLSVKTSWAEQKCPLGKW
jgi:hypothetical protein